MIWIGIFIGGCVGIVIGGWLGNAKRADLYASMVWYRNKAITWRQKWEDLRSEKAQKAKEN